MNKQEEIFYILQDVRLGNLSEYEATLKLQELGVVIKVERELPKGFIFREMFADTNVEEVFVRKGSLAGYVAVEPLIKEE